MSEKEISLDESFKIAVDFHTRGKISEAKNIYEKILKVKPDHFLALTNLGIIFSHPDKFYIFLIHLYFFLFHYIYSRLVLSVEP